MNAIVLNPVCDVLLRIPDLRGRFLREVEVNVPNKINIMRSASTTCVTIDAHVFIVPMKDYEEHLVS